jgi:hypothetical protein
VLAKSAKLDLRSLDVKRVTIEQLLFLLALVCLGVGLRFSLQDIPNFAPVAALALFAGYYFPSRRVAAMAPLAVMGISDFLIGGYQPLLMATVYALFALPVLLRDVLRRRFVLGGGLRSTLGSVLGLLSCALVASVTFFVVSNFMTWVVTPWYSRSAAGLLDCYVNALPFFRYTLLGDACFALVLFGGYALVQPLMQPVPRVAWARVRK